MARQSISLTKPNDQWLKSLVENEEYSSKSEIVNDLIRKERDRQNELLWLRAKLKKSEERLAVEGPVTQTPEELLAEIKKTTSDPVFMLGRYHSYTPELTIRYGSSVQGIYCRLITFNDLEICGGIYGQK